MTAKQIIDNSFDQLVETLRKTISFDTVKSAACEGAPFGKNNALCLQYVLDTARQMGFDTYNCDGYAGHVDFKGTGDGVLGVLGHLDVVPANADDGWKHPPFDGVTDNGELYGRGTMDDKGPMISCLYALKALKDSGYKPAKTIRLIFGCDEESGMQCMEYYFKKMPFPDISFSPDGDFPVINIEKGIYQFTLDMGQLPREVTEISAGTRTNVVPSSCIARIVNDFDTKDVPFTTDGCKVISAVGKSAHGSTPQEGKNATWEVFRRLKELFPEHKAFAFIADKMCDYTGTKWGIALSDKDSGALTCNIGTARTENGRLILGIDIRFPASYTCDDMLALLKKTTPYDIVPNHVAEPLYVSADSFLVTTLLDIYNTATGQNARPLAIGGGTYSRCLPNCVAFGPLFPDAEQTIHMPNERVSLDTLRTMTYLYLEALERLSK